MPGGVVVRKPLSVNVGSRRTFEERVSLHWPWLPALGMRVVARLSPRSKIRQALIWRAARQGAEAFNRRDIDAVLIGKHPASSTSRHGTWSSSAASALSIAVTRGMRSSWRAAESE